MKNLFKFVIFPLLALITGAAGELLYEKIALFSGAFFITWCLITSLILEEFLLDWSLIYTVLSLLGSATVKYIHSLKGKEPLIENSSPKTRPYDEDIIKDIVLKRLRLMSLAPFFLFLLFFLNLRNKNISLKIAFLFCISLFVIGYGMTSRLKTWNIFALLALVTFPRYYYFLPYNQPYIKKFSFGVIAILIVYFVMIYFLKKYTFKKSLRH